MSFPEDFLRLAQGVVKRFFQCVFLLLTCGLGAAPLPVPSSSGGIIDRQLESEYEAKPLDPYKEAPEIDLDLPEKELNVPEGEKVDIQRIEVFGNTLLSDHELAALTTPHEGTKMSMRDILLLCREIQHLYIEKGYFLVRVFPPVQTVRGGLLKIEIVEAEVGAVQVEGNTHYSEKFIRKYFDHFTGKCIQYDELVKKILLLNEFSDLNAGVAFLKGKQPGTTDMLVRIRDARPLHLAVDYNTYGSGENSRKRAGGRLESGNTFLQGDDLTLIAVSGFPFESLQFDDVVYSLPLNASGTSLEVSALHSNFKVNRMEELDLSGNTLNVKVGVDQAMQRTRGFSSTFFASFNYLDVRNYQKHHLNTLDALRIVNVGGKFDNLDKWSGRNFGSVEVSAGIPSFLDGLKATDHWCSRPGAGGRFGFLGASYQRLQPMPGKWLLYVNFSGQLAFCKLPVSEEFYIGGQGSVRGYPNAAALGDSGFVAGVEGRMPAPFFATAQVPWTKKKWGDVLHLVTFVDHGEVYTIGGEKQEGQTGRVYMTSAGVGARIFVPWNIDVNLDWGFPLGNQERSSDSIFYVKVSKRFL